MILIALAPPPEPPPAIVVVGKALPHPASERAYSGEAIDRDRLEKSPSHQLDEVLKQVPGLQLFRRSDSTSGHPTSQGVTLRALGGNAASRALLILDGVPQADPFGGWVNWPAYDPASLDQVRIVRGGGSVVHGPGALAGVIDLTSVSAAETAGTLEAGSRRSLLGRGYVGIDAGDGLLALSARGARSDGFIPVTEETRGPVDERAPYREASIRARWIKPIAAKVELQAGALGFVDVRERGVPFTGNRTLGLDGSLRLVGSGRWQWSAAGYAQWRNFRSSFASVDDARITATRVSLQDSVPSEGFGAAVEVRPPVGRGVHLRLGGDLRFTNGESRELFAYAAGEPTRRRIAGGDSATQGLFAEGTWTGGSLTLTGGARLDHWTIWDGALVERTLATGATTRDDRFPSRSGWRPTARAGVLVEVGGGLSLRSAAYLGWRMPTLNELFRPFRAGPDATAANPLLEPERLAGAEVGLGFRAGPLGLSVTAFANRLSGAIANVTLGQGPGVFPGVGFVAGTYRQRQNLRAIAVRGIEAAGEARLGNWSLGIGASYAHAEVRSDGLAGALDGLRPAQTPKITLSGHVTWEKAGRSAALHVRHVGSQYEDDLNGRRLAAATTFDGYVAWPLSGRVQLVGRGENLLDETVVAGISADGTVERAAPRTIWIGVRLGD